jgi:hypothetical protein
MAGVPSPSPSAVSSVDTRASAIQRTLAAYESGYETLNVSALGSVWDLSPEQEKRLREVFKAFKSYEIDMAIGPVEYEADGRARVRVSSQHTVNGRKQQPLHQVFVLVQRGEAWRIVSFATDK